MASDRTYLSPLEHRAIRAHAWLVARGGACHRDHVQVTHRRGMRLLHRRGVITQTAGGVYQIPGVL